MSFVYPRVISVRRRPAEAGVGAVGYGGSIPENETIIAQGIDAAIQLSRDGRKPEANLPADGRKTTWRILFKLPNGTVADRDIIVDDLGLRYQVVGAYWNSLGYNCLCERQET